MGVHAIAAILGIDEPRDELALIELTRRGLPGDTIDVLAKNTGLTISELSHVLHVSSRTLMRRKGKLLDPHLSDHMVMISTVFARCTEMFQGSEKASRWLKSPILALWNSRPLDLLDTTAGVTMVLNLLGRIEHGVVS